MNILRKYFIVSVQFLNTEKGQLQLNKNRAFLTYHNRRFSMNFTLFCEDFTYCIFGTLDCDHRMVVAESHLQCWKEVITTLDSLSSPGKRSLYLCSWNKKIGDALSLYGLLKDLNNCEIVPEESLYLFNGSWKSCSSQDPFLAKLNVEIGQHPVLDNDQLYLKVNEN